MSTRYDLPPAVSYVYDQVVIDLGECVIRHKDGRETALAGMPYDLLALLLTQPRRVFTYKTLAEKLRPEFNGRRRRKWDELDLQQQEAVRHALHALVCRTRDLLGEPGGTPSLLVNRPGLGYAIQRPRSTIYAVESGEPGPRSLQGASDSHTPAPQSATSTSSPLNPVGTHSNENGHELE